MSERGATSSRNLLAELKLADSRDVVAARQAVARFMKERGASALKVTRFATAVSEIARNAIVHGGGGSIAIYVATRGGEIFIDCRDSGPGIVDIPLALTEGYTSAGGLGRGLGGAKRLSKSFEIRTTPGEGTSVLMSVDL